MDQDLKLTVELVPGSAWHSNLRKMLARPDWDALRRKVYAMAGFVCEICGGRGDRHPVECHETWEWIMPASPGNYGTQRLVALRALCPACHEVKHMGRARSVGRKEEAMEHLMRINGWQYSKAHRYVEAAFREWEKRSRVRGWVLDRESLRALGVPAIKEGS